MHISSTLPAYTYSVHTWLADLLTTIAIGVGFDVCRACCSILSLEKRGKNNNSTESPVAPNHQ